MGGQSEPGIAMGGTVWVKNKKPLGGGRRKKKIIKNGLTIAKKCSWFTEWGKGRDGGSFVLRKTEKEKKKKIPEGGEGR